MRKVSAALVVIGLAAVTMLAWWSMLAAERAAVRADQRGAQRVAVATALALRGGGDARALVALTETSTGSHLLVRDATGRVVAGTATASDRLMTVHVPGSDLSVAAAVDDSGLGVGRYSHVITAVAFLVMACSVGLLAIVARDRRAARAELDRLGKRWEEVAAADDLTGLGNRMRLLEDVDALIARGTRYGNSFGLALFEVPGDPTSDEVLEVAEALTAQARTADMVYRVSPTRFVSLLPEQDETGAALAAERIRRALLEALQLDVYRGVTAFSPWLPCNSTDLLVRAELDLGASALMADIPPRERLVAADPEVTVTPHP